MFTYWGYTQASMLIGDFKHRLKKISPELFVREETPTRMDGLWHAGIYLRLTKQKGLSYDTKGRGDARVEKYFAALETGQLDKYLCGVCLEWIPEFDVFNANYTKIAVPGWRSIAMQLVEKKVATLAQVRKAFESSSLGEIDYDRMSFFNKMKFAKRIDLGEENAK